MASHETTTICSSFMQGADFPVAGDDPPPDDDMYYSDGSDVDEETDDVVKDHMDTHMSPLSVESSEGDADAESSDDKKKDAASDDEDDIITLENDRDINYSSLPGTPIRFPPRRRAGSTRQYASETEDRGDRARRKSAGRGGAGADRPRFSSYYCKSAREDMSWVGRAWEMRRWHCAAGDGGCAESHSGGGSPCVVVRPRGRGAASMCMDMDEVRACRDLGLELPCDWTVELPPVAFHGGATADTGGGGDSPVGVDPWDMKARLRVWAQAVALASTSRLSG